MPIKIKNLSTCLALSAVLFALFACTGQNGKSPLETDGILGRSPKAFYNTLSNTSADILLISASGKIAATEHIEAGVITPPTIIATNLVQMSSDGTVATIIGKPGIYQYSPVEVSSVASGSASLPPPTIDTYCNGFSMNGYTELLVESVQGTLSFVASGNGQNSTIGNASPVSKTVGTPIVVYQQADFGTLQINTSVPSPRDAMNFQASFSLSVSSPWQGLSLYCHVSNTKTHSSSALYQDFVMADSPTGYWRLGESSGTLAQDSSGNGYTGTYTQDPTMGNPDPLLMGIPGALFGNASTAVTFNNQSTNYYVDAGNIPALNFEYTHAFTLEAWIKTSNTTADEFILAKQLNAGNFTGYALIVQSQGGYIYGVQNVVSLYVENKNTAYIQVLGSTIVTDGKWHHVVSTYDGSGSTQAVKIYVDGNAETLIAFQNNLSGNSIASSAHVTVGARDSGGVPFQGSLEEAAIYGTALSPARVSAHFSAGVGH